MFHCGCDPCWWSTKYHVAIILIDDMSSTYDYSTQDGIESGRNYIFDLLEKDGARSLVDNEFPACVMDGVYGLLPDVNKVPTVASKNPTYLENGIDNNINVNDDLSQSKTNSNGEDLEKLMLKKENVSFQRKK